MMIFKRKKIKKIDWKKVKWNKNCKKEYNWKDITLAILSVVVSVGMILFGCLCSGGVVNV